MRSWPRSNQTALEEVAPEVVDLTARLDAALNDNELLTERVEESFADMEFAAEDRGWVRLGAETEQAMSRKGLGPISTNCRVMAVASPLVKRGKLLRTAYVWGQGVTVSSRDDDVNAVIQTTIDDEKNQATIFGSQAQEELEGALYTDGQIFVAAFTLPLTGQVQFRTTPLTEVQDVVTNPEDRDEPWLYLRQYDAQVVEPGTVPGTTRIRKETRREYHPAMGFWPAQRPQMVDGIRVRWDAPILHISVNRLDGAKWGVPDALAAIFWARGYEGFLTDWARLMRALSKFAWRLSGEKSSKARQAAQKIRDAVPSDPRLPALGAQPSVGSGPVGAVAAGGPGVTLEAIPKSGATIDADSGRPLGAMVAAALGLPVTTLLADPGITGARATAETLDKPTVLEMGMRRKLWAAAYQRLLQYVVLQSVKAPRGALKGTVAYDEWGRQVYRFAEDVDATIEISFPKLDDLDPKTLIEAIARADETGKMPPVETMKLLLKALGVDDIDEIIEDFTDDEGNWIDPLASAGQAAVDRFNDGGDPADVVR